MNGNRITLIALGLATCTAAQAEVPVPSTNFDIVTQAVTEHGGVNLQSQQFAEGDSGAWWASDGQTTSTKQAGGNGNGCISITGVSLEVQRKGNDSQVLPKHIVVRDDLGSGQHDYHALSKSGKDWVEMLPDSGSPPTLQTLSTFDSTNAFARVESNGVTYLFNTETNWITVQTGSMTRAAYDESLVEVFYDSSQLLGVSSTNGASATTNGYAGPVAFTVPNAPETAHLVLHCGPQDLRAFSAYTGSWKLIATTASNPTVAHGETLSVIEDTGSTHFYSARTGNVTTHASVVSPTVKANCAAWIEGGVGYVYRPIDDSIVSVANATSLLQGDEWAAFRTTGGGVQAVSTQVTGSSFAVNNLTGQSWITSKSGATTLLVRTNTKLHAYSSYDNQWSETSPGLPIRWTQAQGHVAFAIVGGPAQLRDTPLIISSTILFSAVQTIAPNPTNNRTVYAFSPRESTWATTAPMVDEVRSSQRVVITRGGNTFSAFGPESRQFHSVTASGGIVDWGAQAAYAYVQTPGTYWAYSSVTDRWYSTPITSANPTVRHSGRLMMMLDGTTLVQFRALSDIRSAADWGTGRTPSVRQAYPLGGTLQLDAIGPPGAAHVVLANTARAAVPISLPSGVLEVELTGMSTIPMGTFSPEGTNTITLSIPALPGTPPTFYLQSLVGAGTGQLGQLAVVSQQ